MTAKISDDKIAKIREMHAAGASRNEIARTLGVSGSTVTKWTTRAGLDFDREGTRAATAAKVADAKARRAQLQLDLLDKAAALLDKIDKPALAFNFGGKENTYSERVIDEPTFVDKRNIVQAVSTAIASSIRIDEHDKASGVEDQKAALVELMGTLKHAWNAANGNGASS